MPHLRSLSLAASQKKGHREEARQPPPEALPRDNRDDGGAE
jgi:hypothetical protein